jgi:ketosteroid isomerase-like protein
MTAGGHLRFSDGAAEREPTADEAAVLAAHEQFWQSYARRDLDGRFAVCAEDVFFFGTALHERAVDRQQYRAMNQKGVEQFPEPFTIRCLRKEVRLWGDAAWVECDTLWIMGQCDASTRDIVRQTTILKRMDRTWWVAHVHGSDPEYRLREGEYMTHGNIHARNKELEREVLARTEELRKEKARSEELLLNILPAEVADELKATGAAEARHFATATILFTDFKGFTEASERLTPQDSWRSSTPASRPSSPSSPHAASRRSRPSAMPTWQPAACVAMRRIPPGAWCRPRWRCRRSSKPATGSAPHRACPPSACAWASTPGPWWPASWA